MPVHMVIGMAGNTYQPNWEQTYSHTIGEPRWSLFRSLSFGAWLPLVSVEVPVVCVVR